AGFPELTSGSRDGQPFYPALLFFGRRAVRPMPDCCHHGEGEHDKRDMAMPAMPGAGLVMVEPQFVLGRLETILDRPAMTLDHDQGFDASSNRTPGQVLTFRTRARLSVAPPTCRMPLGQSQCIPQAYPGRWVSPRFWHRLIAFRLFNSGSLALASLNHACRTPWSGFFRNVHHRGF